MLVALCCELIICEFCLLFYCLFCMCRGYPNSYYQKALLSNGVTSALRLHQRVPNFQFSREYLGRLFLEDSAHYLFYSLIFVTGPSVSSILASASFYQLGTVHWVYSQLSCKLTQPLKLTLSPYSAPS